MCVTKCVSVTQVAPRFAEHLEIAACTFGRGKHPQTTDAPRPRAELGRRQLAEQMVNCLGSEAQFKSCMCMVLVLRFVCLFGGLEARVPIHSSKWIHFWDLSSVVGVSIFRDCNKLQTKLYHRFSLLDLIWQRRTTFLLCANSVPSCDALLYQQLYYHFIFLIPFDCRSISNEPSAGKKPDELFPSWWRPCEPHSCWPHEGLSSYP